MSHIIPLPKINQFLPADKLQLAVDQHDEWVKDLEEAARDTALAMLSAKYATSTWVDHVSMPKLVVQAIGMLTAGWLYDRQFSAETEGGFSYGTRKVREAYALLEGILEGKYIINREVIVDPLQLPSILETEPVFIMEERI